MCGRYYMDDNAYSEIRKWIRQIDGNNSSNHRDGRDERDGNLMNPGNGDIRPSEPALVITGKTSGHGYTADQRMVLAEEIMYWGFPQYDRKALLINARAETVLQKKTFRDSVLHRRCLIPARYFYEWDASKNKVTCRHFDSSVIYMAGFYHSFQGQNRFVIITTEANDSLRKIHGRMPLILEQNELENWIFDDNCLEFLLHKTPVMMEHEQEYEQLTLPFL